MPSPSIGGGSVKSLRTVDLHLVTGSEAKVDVCGRDVDVRERGRTQDALGPHCRRHGTADISLSQHTGRTAPSCHAPATSWPRYPPRILID